ncbi:MAG: adenosylcobalamin-dependent ribonucleoside-diphosphate reductase [Bdellovibrionales bacterium]|nr:adenosylcobalamin-dependent ribonucleoside-diphosphate reductase [Bdellovibrionales bacterium]
MELDMNSNIESNKKSNTQIKAAQKNTSTSESELLQVFKRNTVFTDEFSEEVFNMTYKYAGEKDVNDRHLAMAKDLASVEAPHWRLFWTEKFLDILEDFKFVPGGRITSNAGTGLNGTTYINCFVSGFRGEKQDSMESIMDELKRQALILKSEGGYGFCVDVLRPRGAFVNGIGSESPGAVKLLEMWDTQSAVITAGSGKKKTDDKKGKVKIRKGAQMVTMSVFHPDIEEYITAKQTPGRLTKFNMSVLISDEFMDAVKNGKEWKLEFPDHENFKEEYDKYWDGNLQSWKEKGFKVKVYKRFENANQLWDLIMKSTYNRNEPGVLFVDTINKLNNLYYEEYINATNPCGEQVLPIGGCCLLGSLNLTQFVDIENNTWDYKKLREIIPTAIRFMDNVNDKSLVPLPEQKENLLNKRRIGLGVLGYGSALMMLKIRYGSQQAIERTEELCNFIMNEAYSASAEIAKEKGAFPAYNEEKYLAGNFIKGLKPNTIDKIKKYGVRNSHLLSIQPTGNSSVFANNVSGGLEPLFMADYIRTSIQPSAPDGLEVPKNIDWGNKTFDIEGEQKWEWKSEGDEKILVTRFNNEVWKMDSHRGLLKESRVRDYAVRYHETQKSWNPKADWAATTFDLNIDDHVKTMGVFSKYIDSAMSKTVNIPKSYPYEDFKRLYREVYETGTIKGCTSYREGTMTAVLSAASTSEVAEGIPHTKAAPRPQELECDIHHLTTKGEKWVVIVGLLKNDPYEVFAMKQSRLHLPTKLKKGKLIKEKSRVYHLETEDGWLLTDIRNFFESDEQEALTRMISTALRHGANIEFIVSQLIKSEGIITSFSKAIARTLKLYVKNISGFKCSDCDSSNIKLQEGCFVCLDCGSSKCE